MSNTYYGDAGQRGPDHDRPEVALSRYDADRWTLSDGEGVIVATAEDLVPAKQ